MNIASLDTHIDHFFSGANTTKPASRIGFITAIFTGALLIFLVQPIFAKLATPLLGGAAAVWTVLVVCFQASLLGGYYYAHRLTKFDDPKRQLLIHMIFLAIGGAFLPFSLSADITPDASNPTLWLVGFFLLTLAIPFTALSATAPIVQKWYTRSGQADSADPYYLYAASNIGSLIALIGYPVLIEPLIGVSSQIMLWSVAYFGLTLTLAFTGLQIIRRSSGSTALRSAQTSNLQDADAAAPNLRTRMGWLLFAAIPSSLMLGATTHITTEVAAAPFLWLPPLALYILSFIVAFSRKQNSIETICLFGMLIFASCALLDTRAGLALNFYLEMFFDARLQFSLWLTFAVSLLTVLLSGLYFHEKLARTRPDPAYLTDFFLMLSLGGVLGGAFNSLLAPQIFSTIAEYPLVLCLSIILATSQITNRTVRLGCWVLTGLLTALTLMGVLGTNDNTYRNFYGKLSVQFSQEDGKELRVLAHGMTKHGLQAFEDDGTPIIAPNITFGPDTPIGQSMAALPPKSDVAVIGQGIGTVLCYAKPHQNWYMYEINPLIDQVARDTSLFTFMRDCIPGTSTPTILGDARLMLQQKPERTFDMILVDAFSSNSIPVHLVTREALELYFNRLNENGVVVFHISNRSLSLEYPLGRLAESLGLVAYFANYKPACTRNCWQNNASEVVIMARNAGALAALQLETETWIKLESDGRRLWTDDYANIPGALIYHALGLY